MIEVRSVGVIGLGKIGRPAARHLRNGGFDTHGFDVMAAAAEASRQEGIKIAESPAALAAVCDLIFAVPSFEDQVEEAFFGPNGVVEGARSGSIVAVGSTIAPEAMRRFAARLAEHDLIPLDVPVCRGVPAAESGTLSISGAGDIAAFEACRAAFSTFAEPDAIHHLGPVGAGQIGKMVNNLIMWAVIGANHEGFLLGEKLGLEREPLRAMLLNSSAANWAMETRASERPAVWVEKDMTIILGEADEARISLPLTAVAREVMKSIKIDRGEPMPPRS